MREKKKIETTDFIVKAPTGGGQLNPLKGKINGNVSFL